MSRRVIIRNRDLSPDELQKARSQISLASKRLKIHDAISARKRLRKLSSNLKETIFKLRSIERIYNAKSIPQIKKIVKNLS